MCVYCRKHASILSLDKQKQDGAASIIQQHWRRRQATAKQEKYQKESEDSIVDIQRTLKAHLARKQSLSSNQIHQLSFLTEQLLESGKDLGEDTDSEDSFDAIQVIQSAMKGHLTRQMVLQDHIEREYVHDLNL